MKAIRSTPMVFAVATAASLLVSMNCNADGKALGECRNKLYANGVSTSLKIVYEDGYCYVPDSCHQVADYLFVIPSLGTHVYNPNDNGYTPNNPKIAVQTAKQEVAKACTECKSGGKPRCLKIGDSIW